MIKVVGLLATCMFLFVAWYGYSSLQAHEHAMQDIEAAAEQPIRLEAYKPPVPIPSVRQYSELVEPTAFINSDPFTLKEIVGQKIILLTFITYSDPNSQHTFDFLKDMQRKYGSEGLQVIAIHTPEFGYEHEPKLVTQELVEKHGLTFPIVIDNSYGTWKAYKNHYWPARYIIDRDGTIAFVHTGEGAYTETEAALKPLLMHSAQ